MVFKSSIENRDDKTSNNQLRHIPPRPENPHPRRQDTSGAGSQPRTGAALLDIPDRQDREGWGAKVIERLARDLRSEFQDMKGLSPRNMLFMRAFAKAFSDEEKVKQLVSQLPWGRPPYAAVNSRSNMQNMHIANLNQLFEAEHPD